MASRLLTIFLLLLWPFLTEAQPDEVRFQRLTYAGGLSDQKVNCILKSRDGYLWLGTPLGLNRFDGLRVHSFYNHPGDANSLPDNTILGLSEDAEGMLWVETPAGFCIFNPITDKAERNTSLWLSQHGMKGKLLRVAADNKRNLWIVTDQYRLYYYDFSSKKALTVAADKGALAHISFLFPKGERCLLTSANGTVAFADLQKRRIVSVDRSVAAHCGKSYPGFSAFVDSRNGIWIWSTIGAWHYDATLHTWKPIQNIIVSGVAEDLDHHILMATDHDGLVIADLSGNIITRILNDPSNGLSLPDNTLQTIYVDNLGVVWIGMYRMGLAYFYHGQTRFPLLPWGDICTMTQTLNGDVWFGTNDSGFGRAAGLTGSVSIFGQGQTGLGSNVVVSSLAAHDGSLWFGTFQGGLVRMKDGHYTVYRQSGSGLGTDDVWALAELPDGRIAIGTLGSGLQLLNPSTGRFTTINTHNSNLTSDYIASLSLMKDGRLVLGHSQGISILNIRTRKAVNIGPSPINGVRLSSLSVNQVYVGSRGLLWIATGSGLNVYDLKTGRLYPVSLSGKREHAEVCAVTEDHQGVVWCTTGYELKSIQCRRNGDGWLFTSNTYNAADGLQLRLFNKRSILCLRDGRLLVGGVDGVNVINTLVARRKPMVGKVLFSGFTLFDRPIEVGDTVNGHVILNAELNSTRKLVLHSDENTFSVQLASSVIGLPEHVRFLYRLHGAGDDWSMTPEGTPQVQFTNLAPGRYELEVRATDNSGNPVGPPAVLAIRVKPPFYLSVWAWLFYFAVAIAAVFYGFWRMRKTQREKMEKLELTKQKEVEEMKLTFFTNLSHELRTPLTLILAPLESLIARETNPDISQKLRLMQRSATNLLKLVNQMLDLRRIMRGKEVLNMSDVDVVALVRDVCTSFSTLSEKNITLTFVTDSEQLLTSLDKDKVAKIITNLLSNAYKFTPKGGRVEVRINHDAAHVNLIVADNGKGISDEDKKHLFERFYQSKSNDETGGSGIGLNLVYEYTRMMGGDVTVGDNAGGGAVFTVSLPYKPVEAPVAVTSAGSAPKHSEVSVLSLGDKASPASDAKLPDAPQGTILLVDDNDDFLNFLSGELSAYYTIRTASDGKQALESIHKSMPDLVLTDVMMPEMDGNELCRQIKSDNDTKQLPVIMLTARLSDENEIESRECGADDYVKKPFNMELLRLRINRLLDKGRINEEGKLKPVIAQPEITPEDEKFVDKVTKYIEAHLDDTDLSVEQMATDIGMSRVQLYRRLVSVTGKTPSEFIRLIRLRHAERLLAESQLTVSEIAYRVGFSSQRYFSKCFKDLYGYMPSQYKRM